MKNHRVITQVFIFVLLFITSNNTFSQFDTSYDLRNYGLITSVKNQGNTCGACWAFASCASIESSWLKQSYGTYDLSEDNLLDCHNFDPNPCDWGNFYFTQALLSMHGGIYSETQDPYTPALQNCPSSMTYPPIPLAYVEEVRFIEGSKDIIKQTLLDYGAVASTMFFRNIPANYDAVNFKYYDSSITIDDEPYAHCVTIVGWDDNMTFTGAPGNGGWIIKDSFGTSWADNGYFYCSYYDDGILTTNAIFPTKKDIPPTVNGSFVYYHDEFGWVDNYGFSSKEAYALVKYTISSFSGNVSPQQIKRIGTYAVTDNTTISIEVYETFSSNTLSNLVATATINCPTKGFYTVPLSLKSQTVNSTLYIKAKYVCKTGTTKPIPIEKTETGSSSGFTASSNSCWVSNNGNAWTQIGQGTSYDFDACIKMYTENASLSEIAPLATSACEGDDIAINSIGSWPADSVQWFINNIYKSNFPNDHFIPVQSGDIEIKLITWLGDNKDTDLDTIQVNTLPLKPTITQNENVLKSSSAFSYQWLYNDLAPIPDETNQTFAPNTESIYFVEVRNANNCTNISDAFNFITVSVDELNKKNIYLYPHPVENTLNIHWAANSNSNKITIVIYNILGQLVINNSINKNDNGIDVQQLKPGVYILRATNNNGEIYKNKFVKK